MSPSCFSRVEVIPSTSAASDAWSADFHRIDAQPSGEITEYVEYWSISVTSPTAIASAPPEPPSPMTVTMIGTRSPAISYRLRPMASDCPRSSAPMPGYAPGVSTKVNSGSPNFSASFISLSALR